MPARYDYYLRLEPHPQRGNFAAGFAAAVFDPVWFLARQWQMGEHQGENATTPVLLRYDVTATPLAPYQGDPRLDPTVVPAEAIVETEPDDWWTMGRRVRIGAAVAAAAGLDPGAVGVKYLFARPAPPYERLASRFDGLMLWRGRTELGLGDDAFAAFGIPAAKPFFWKSDELLYATEFEALTADGPVPLVLPAHRGGRVDWFSADAYAGGDPFTPVEPVENREVYPAALQYPGAPNSRWWEIEDAAVDIGGYPPDSSHFPTALLIDLVASHGDDWFLFPITTRLGHIVRLHGATVTDSFGDEYLLTQPDDWWLFKTSGLDKAALVLWLRALSPLQGEPLENVLLGLDEFSNYLWAVERRVMGRELAPFEPTTEQEQQNPPLNGGRPSVDTDKRPEFVYIPGKNAAPYWHPYEVEERPDEAGNVRRRFVQRRLVDLARKHPVLLPAPQAEVLRALSPDGEYVHEIAPATVPSIGIELERRYVLARDMRGMPILWIQRQRMPFLTPPARAMRWDVMEEQRLAV